MSQDDRLPPLGEQAKTDEKILDGLSAEQKIAFQEFKQKCGEQGLLKRSSELVDDDTCDGINDDAVLLYVSCIHSHLGLSKSIHVESPGLLSSRRFLRARKYNVEEAYLQFNKACETRDANKLISVYERFDVSEFERARHLVRDDIVVLLSSILLMQIISTPTGLVVAIDVECLYAFSTSPSSILKPCQGTRQLVHLQPMEYLGRDYSRTLSMNVLPGSYCLSVP
jgi:hypothetical protein